VGPASGTYEPKSRPTFSPKNPPPNAIKDYIVQCWQPDPSKRPDFADILKQEHDKYPWEAAALSVSANRNTKGKEILEPFTEGKKDIKFKALLKQIAKALQLEGTIDPEQVHDPNVRAIAALLGVENVGKHTVPLSVVERFIKWLGGDKQILSIVYSVCCEPWFWGAYSLDNARVALSKSPSVGTFLVRWDDPGANWFITYVGQDPSAEKKGVSIVLDEQLELTTGGGDHSVSQLMTHVRALVKNSKKFKTPAPDRPIQYTSIEIKAQWLTGGHAGLYAQETTKKKSDDAEFATHDTVAGHYNFVL